MLIYVNADVCYCVGQSNRKMVLIHIVRWCVCCCFRLPARMLPSDSLSLFSLSFVRLESLCCWALFMFNKSVGLSRATKCFFYRTFCVNLYTYNWLYLAHWTIENIVVFWSRGQPSTNAFKFCDTIVWMADKMQTHCSLLLLAIDGWMELPSIKWPLGLNGLNGQYGLATLSQLSITHTNTHTKKNWTKIRHIWITLPSHRIQQKPNETWNGLHVSVSSHSSSPHINLWAARAMKIFSTTKAIYMVLSSLMSCSPKSIPFDSKRFDWTIRKPFTETKSTRKSHRFRQIFSNFANTREQQKTARWMNIRLSERMRMRKRNHYHPTTTRSHART